MHYGTVGEAEVTIKDTRGGIIYGDTIPGQVKNNRGGIILCAECHSMLYSFYGYKLI